MVPHRPDRGRQPAGGADANLDTITAVVIGGTSLFGGRGSIWGTLIGALIVGGARNGLTISGHRRAVAGLHGRRAHHRRRGPRPVGAEGGRMTAVDRPRRSRAAVLEARGLVKTYGRVVALDHADFEL